MNYKKILKKLDGIEVNEKINNNDFLEKLKNIEDNYHTHIPDEYVLFLKQIKKWKFNQTIGIKSKEDISVISENIVPVDFFDIDSILSTINRFNGNLPDNLLPIAEGVAGDLIVMDLSPENYGKVYYWYHEHDSDYSGLYLLGNDFTEFMNNLLIVPESDVSTDDVNIVWESDEFLDMLKDR